LGAKKKYLMNLREKKKDWVNPVWNVV